MPKEIAISVSAPADHIGNNNPGSYRRIQRKSKKKSSGDLTGALSFIKLSESADDRIMHRRLQPL